MIKKFCVAAISAFLLAACSPSGSENEVSGILRLGHEIRSFTDQSDNNEYWVIDKSGKLMAEYKKIIGTEIINNQPVWAKLKVRKAQKQQDGFGKDYAGTYEVEEIVSLQKPN